MMEAWEWRRVFAALPDPTPKELAKFIERKRWEDAEREKEKEQITKYKTQDER